MNVGDLKMPGHSVSVTGIEMSSEEVEVDKTTCVICLKSFTSSSVRDETDNLAVTFESFFQGYNIKLPVGSVGWDFSFETPPLCSDCEIIAERLVRLRNELAQIKALVKETENVVQETIINSELKSWKENANVEDFRIRAVRDFVVGPIVSK